MGGSYQLSAISLVAVLAAGCGPAPAKAPDEETLSLPADTLEAGWGQIPVAAALGPGRWVVVAPDWDAAAIADFGKKSVTPLGGPKQQAYLHPFRVFVSGDSVYLADWGKQRTTVWSTAGVLVDSLPAAAALRGNLPWARDAAGQWYYEVRPEPGPDGRGNADSAAIVRAPKDLSRFDTVAALAPLDLKEMFREQSRRFERLILSGADLWGVWPDGTLWIARLLRNQVERRDPRGKVTRGPELPDPVYEVTQADRQRYLQGFPPDVRPKEGDLPWALVHPPFVGALMAPDQTIWLLKSKPALDSARRIQVLRKDGSLARLFRMIGEGRVIAVGPETALVAEQFERGIRLMEVRIPATPPAAPGGGPAPPRTSGG